MNLCIKGYEGFTSSPSHPYGHGCKTTILILSFLRAIAEDGGEIVVL